MISEDLLFQMDAFLGIYSVGYGYILFFALIGASSVTLIYRIIYMRISKRKGDSIFRNTIPDKLDPFFMEKLTQYLRREIGGFPIPDAHTGREMRLHQLKAILEDIEQREYSGAGFSSEYIDAILMRIDAGKK